MESFCRTGNVVWVLPAVRLAPGKMPTKTAAAVTWVFVTIALAGFSPPIQAGDIFRDDFSSPDGSLIGTTADVGGTWSQTGSNSTNPIQTSAGRAVITTVGQDLYSPLLSPVALRSGTDMKTSLDLNVTAAHPNGDYFLHFTNPIATTMLFYQRLFARSSPNGYQLGLVDTGGTGTSPTWGTQELAYGSSHHVDILWHAAPGGAHNDTFTLTLDGAPYLSHTWTSSSSGEPIQIPAVNLRQGNSTDTVPTVFLDNLVVSTIAAPPAPNNIFEWQYVNPANLTQGKQPSAVVAYDGYGIQAGPGLNAANYNLTKAYLAGANLTGASFNSANLTEAELDYANLSNATLENGILLRANFSHANLTNARLSGTLTRANFAHANFTSANLNGANLNGANLGDAILTDAIVAGANLSSTRITPDQLYLTASFLNHDFTGTHFVGNNLSGINLAGQILVSTNFYAAKLVGANLTNANATYTEFVNADLSNANLTGANLTSGSVALANLSGATLTNANLSGANFIGTNLAGADIRGANLSRIQFISYQDPLQGYVCGPKHNGAPCSFSQPILFWGFPTPVVQTVGTGITLSQLVTTASYAARDLSGVALANSSFNGANFAGFNLTNSNFNGTALVGADFSGADARGASGLSDAAGANFIRPDGHVAGLNLAAGQSLVVRDYDAPEGGTAIPIRVDQQFSLATGATLQMIFDADPWDSEISFASGISVLRGGTLDLAFAPGIDVASQVGRTFDLFDWTGVVPTGTFAIHSPYLWDISQLYTTGQVTYLAGGSAGSAALSQATPEPAAWLLVCVGLATFPCRRLLPV